MYGILCIFYFLVKTATLIILSALSRMKQPFPHPFIQLSRQSNLQVYGILTVSYRLILICDYKVWSPSSLQHSRSEKSLKPIILPQPLSDPFSSIFCKHFLDQHDRTFSVLSCFSAKCYFSNANWSTNYYCNN